MDRFSNGIYGMINVRCATVFDDQLSDYQEARR